MADVELVIKIPEENYERLKFMEEMGALNNPYLETIANGIPLPKGHGDLVDRKELLKAIDTWDKFGVDNTNSLFRLDNLSLPHYVPYTHYDDMVKSISSAETIIEADKENEEL